MGSVDMMLAVGWPTGYGAELLWLMLTGYLVSRLGIFGLEVLLNASSTKMLWAFLYKRMLIIPTMRDPKAIRIETTPIDTEDLSNMSALDGVDVDIGVDIRDSADDKAEIRLGWAVTAEFWCSSIVG